MNSAKSSVLKKVRRIAGARGNRKRSPRRGGSAAIMQRLALSVMPRLGKARGRFGLGVVVCVVQRAGPDISVRFASLEEAFVQPGNRPRAKLLARVDSRRLALLVTGLAHPDRIRIMKAILSGANTHQLLKEAAGLKTGPLYFHLRGLQGAGLIEVATRNSYLPTATGEDLLYAATALATNKVS